MYMEGLEEVITAWLYICTSSYLDFRQLPWWLAGVPLLLLSIIVGSSISWLFYRQRCQGHQNGGDGSQLHIAQLVPVLPPGSMGPLLQLRGVSETLQFAFCNSCPIGCPPPFLSSRLRKYGSVFKTHLMGRPMVVSMDPELNKLLLSNEGKLVQVDFPSFIKKIVGPMLTTRGPRHRCIRALASSILNPAAIQAFHIIPVQEVARSILSSWSHMPIVDAQNEFQKFIFGHMVRSLLSLEPEDPDTQMLMRDYPLLMSGYSAVPVDLPGFTYNKVLKARKRILNKLSQLVQDRRKNAVQECRDFLDGILKQKDECGNYFGHEDIAEFIFIMILGGFETTSILLTTVTKFLSENEHVIDELRKEHLRIRENKKPEEMVTWDEFKQMHFTELVIKEALRMATILHSLTREALQDIVFKDMVIPKGWTILINFSMVHLNPNYYKNPLSFDPWRWKDTENNNQSVLMPFGGGIRSCVGSVLVKVEVSIFLHYLVTTYKWDRITKGNDHLDVVSGLSFPTMKKGLLIKIEPLCKTSQLKQPI